MDYKEKSINKFYVFIGLFVIGFLLVIAISSCQESKKYDNYYLKLEYVNNAFVVIEDEKGVILYNVVSDVFDMYEKDKEFVFYYTNIIVKSRYIVNNKKVMVYKNYSMDSFYVQVKDTKQNYFSVSKVNVKEVVDI